MEATKLFGYAAAMSLLAFGFASCDPDEQKQDPAPGPSTTVRFSVEVTEVTETTAKAEVTVRGDENATWYAFVTTDTDTEAEDLITSAVGELSDIESVLKTGNDEVEFTDLTAGTDYRIIVTGLAADGTVSGKAADEEFSTERDPNAWEANPDWKIEYAGRGSFEVTGGTMYGDKINITVAEGDLNYYYLTALSAADFSSLYNSSVATFANSVITELNALIEENNEMYPDSPVSILDLLYTGSASLIMELLANEPQYLFMIGIDANGLLGEGTGLYAQSEQFTPMVEEASTGYKKWLGDWTISGTGTVTHEDMSTSEETVTEHVTIVESIPNYEYTVYGWQQGLMGTYGEEDAIGFVARYNSDAESMSFYSSSNLGTVDTGNYGMGIVEFLGYCDGDDLGGEYAGNEVSINGEYDIAIATMDGSGKVTVEPQVIPLTGGQSVRLLGMQYYATVSAGGLYWYTEHPRFGDDFTMVKGISGSSSSAAAQRSFMKITKKTAAAESYHFPMTRSYMVK